MARKRRRSEEATKATNKVTKVDKEQDDPPAVVHSEDRLQEVSFSFFPAIGKFKLKPVSR